MLQKLKGLHKQALFIVGFPFWVVFFFIMLALMQDCGAGAYDADDFE